MVRSQLQHMREAIRSELPEATEKISWSMPTWWQGHNIIHFCRTEKTYRALSRPDAVEHFSSELDELGLKYSKGSIQIPSSDALSTLLIRKIAAWCRDTGNHA